MLADQTQQVEIFFRRLFEKLIQHFRLYLRAQHGSDLFVPARVDAIQFLRARVNELLDHAAFLIQAAGRQRAAFHRIEYAQQMLPLAEDDLTRPRGLALRWIPHQVRAPHIRLTYECQVRAARIRTRPARSGDPPAPIPFPPRSCVSERDRLRQFSLRGSSNDSRSASQRAPRPIRRPSPTARRNQKSKAQAYRPRRARRPS